MIIVEYVITFVPKLNSLLLRYVVLSYFRFFQHT